MAKARLIIYEAGKNPRELEILGDVTTFGRTKDNSVSFPNDGNVSRFHAQIERQGDDFYVSDFGSSNGTSLNNRIVSSAKLIKDGDQINFGGDNSYVIFKGQEESSDEILEEDEDGDSLSSNVNAQPNANQKSETPNPKSSVPVIVTAAAVLGGLAVAAVIGFVVVTQTNVLSRGCEMPEVTILSPETGIKITEPTEIEVQVKNPKCLDRLAYSLDGEEIASAETAPYSVTLDPENLKEISRDAVHILTIAVIDRNGASKIQSDELELTFGKEPVKSGNQQSGSPSDAPADNSATPKSAQITVAETKTLSEQFLKQFPGSYKLNTGFLIEVQKKTAEYSAGGFSNRALPFRDQINHAFIEEQGLDAPLGYLLAMTRSKFDNKKNGANEGLWQMTNDFAASNGYNGQCGGETLSDAKQICAARAAAIYTKALVVNLFQGDVLYGVSCFGMPPSEAGQFQISLPPDRSDFWNVIKSQKQRDMLARFFAAGIVAENPARFGLKQDKPLSSLYKNLIIIK